MGIVEENYYRALNSWCQDSKGLKYFGRNDLEKLKSRYHPNDLIGCQAMTLIKDALSPERQEATGFC